MAKAIMQLALMESKLALSSNPEAQWPGFEYSRNLHSFDFWVQSCPVCLGRGAPESGSTTPALGHHFYCHVGQTKHTKNGKNLINFTAPTTNYFHYSGGGCSFGFASAAASAPEKGPTTMADKNRAGRTKAAKLQPTEAATAAVNLEVYDSASQ